MAEGVVCVDRVCIAFTMQEEKKGIGSQHGYKEVVV